MFQTIKQRIKNIIECSTNLRNINLGYPKFAKFGDYSTSVAIDLAKEKPAREIAEEIRQKINSEMFEKIEIAPQGFINFFLSKEFVYKELENIIKLKDRFGIIENEKPLNIILEFVSANPTGPLNVVNARAAVAGDIIANLLKFTSNKVFKEYFINDMGNQVKLLGESLQARYKQLKGEKTEIPETGYSGDYITEIAKELLDKNIGDKKETEFFTNYAIQKIVSKQKEDLEKFNVQFDSWFSEKELHSKGKVNRTIELLKQKGKTYEKDGKIFFKSTEYGDEKDRVLVREDKTTTYFPADISYHIDKYERGFNLLIDIWGPDHLGHIKRMEAALEALDYEKESLKILICQQVNLFEKGKKVEMSKRAGKFILLEDLIKEVGVDAARFFLAMRTLSSHLDFDMDLAKKQSNENPVYYVQYAYARINSIFAEAEKRGFIFDKTATFYLKLLVKDEELLLAKKLLIFTDEILEAATEFKPNKIPEYLIDVAELLHKFYTECRVLSDDKDLSQARLLLIYCTKIVLKQGLDIIGVTAPVRM